MNLGSAIEVYRRLVLYHQLTETPPAQALLPFLLAAQTGQELEEHYLGFVRSLYAIGPLAGPTGDAWCDFLINRILDAQNPFTQSAKAGVLTPELMETAAFDLRELQHLFGFNAKTCHNLVSEPTMPSWPGWPIAEGGTTAEQRRETGLRLAGSTDWGTQVSALATYYAERQTYAE